jgi:glyoxylase-like metal-dependent hydrolase (beta-lactamase superfamily II)
MSIYILNGFTCNARIPRHWLCGTVELLVETEEGLTLVDTGLGTEDYIHHSGIIKLFQVLTHVPLDPKEAVARQLAKFGFVPEDIKHIVLTHMHFDHCGGLPDFPNAKIHIYRREYEAFLNRPHQFADLAYVKRHIAHKPEWVFYQKTCEKWYDFDAIRLPFEPEMWLVPLPGHTRGLCGVAIKTMKGWLFQASDAAALFNNEAPKWLIRLALGPHNERIRQFGIDHAEVNIITGHMWLDFFEGKNLVIPTSENKTVLVKA